MSAEPAPEFGGWLVKLGGVRKSWKKRYFCIRSKSLGYYKKEEVSNPP